MRKVIQFDVDGVLANFTEGYNRVAAELGRPVLPMGPGRHWDDYTDADVWKAIKSQPFFWQSLPPLVRPNVFLDIWRLMVDNDVYFVTNRPGMDPKKQTIEWLKGHGILEPTVIVSSRKGDVAEALGVTHAIDDKAGNAIYTAYAAPACQSFLLNYPHNQFDHAVIGRKVTRVFSVDEFLGIVEGRYRD